MPIVNNLTDNPVNSLYYEVANLLREASMGNYQEPKSPGVVPGNDPEENGSTSTNE